MFYGKSTRTALEYVSSLDRLHIGDEGNRVTSRERNTNYGLSLGAGKCVVQPADLNDEVVPFFKRSYSADSAPHVFFAQLDCEWALALVACNLVRDVKLLRLDSGDASGEGWYPFEANDEQLVRAQTPTVLGRHSGEEVETRVAGLAITSASRQERFAILVDY